MSEELADSGSEIDMEEAMNSISEDLFPAKEEPEEEFDVVEEIVEEVVEEPKNTSEEAKEEVKEEDSHPAPQSWKKEMHEFWKGLDPAVQNYVEQREAQMKEGLEKDRGDANIGRSVRDIVSPYSDMLRSQGIQEGDLIRNLVNAHVKLSTADDAGRRDLLNQIAQSYNISLSGEAPQVDPVLQAMQSKLNNLEQHLTASQQRARQVEQDKINTQVEAFASDPAHEFFDEVSDKMADLIDIGYSLEDAYASALKLDPILSETELKRLQTEAVEKARAEWKAEGEKARKAKSTNVRGRDTNKAPTEPTGTMEDTLREAYREIQNRSH